MGAAPGCSCGTPLGMLGLLIQRVLERRLPVWSPVLVGLGFGAIAVSLDLIPVGAIVVLVGLLPIARPRRLAALDATSRLQ